MGVWPLSNADAGVALDGRQDWPAGPTGVVRLELDDGCGAEVNLAATGAANVLAAFGARYDPAAPVDSFPGAFAYSPISGRPLSPRLPAATPSGGGDGLPWLEGVSGLSGERRTHRFPSGAGFVVAGEPAALYAVRGESGTVESWLPPVDPHGAVDGEWRQLDVALPEIDLPTWSMAMVAGRHGFVAPTQIGPVFLRTPVLPGRRSLEETADLPPEGLACVGGAARLTRAAATYVFAAPVAQGETLALALRDEAASAPWRVVPARNAPPWNLDSNPTDRRWLAAPVRNARGEVFWPGAAGYLALGPTDEAATWTALPDSFTAYPSARPFRSGVGALWQLGQERTAEGPRFAYRRLRAGGAAGEARLVRNPHLSAGAWTYTNAGAPQRWQRPWDRPVEDQQLKASADSLIAPVLGFAADEEQPATLVAEVFDGAGAPLPLIDEGSEAPHIARFRQHRSRAPLEDLGCAFGIRRLSDLSAFVYADRLFVVHHDEPGRYGPCYSWRVAPSS